MTNIVQSTSGPRLGSAVGTPLNVVTAPPDLVLAIVAAVAQDDGLAAMQSGARAHQESAEQAWRKHHDAIQKAIKASHSSLFGRIFAPLIKVVSAVVAVAASVVTCGTAGALIAVVGVILLTQGDKIASGLADAGIIPHSAAEQFGSALKIAGAVCMSVCSGAGVGATIVSGSGTAVSELSDEAGEALVALGADRDLALAVQITLQIVGVAASCWAGRAAGSSAGLFSSDVSSDVTEVAREIVRDTELANKLGSSAVRIDAASSDYEHSSQMIRAAVQEVSARNAEHQRDSLVEKIRAAVQSQAQIMGIANDIQQQQAAARRMVWARG